MEKNKVNTYLTMYKDKIPTEKTLLLKNALEKADDNCEGNLAAAPMKNHIVILLISIFFGTLGIDRFILGDIGLGVAKLLLGSLTFFIWPLIDIFFSYKKAKEINFNNIMQSL